MFCKTGVSDFYMEKGASMFYKNNSVVWYWGEDILFSLQNLLCTQEKLHQNMSWVHWIRSEVIIRDAFLWSASPWKLYHYWKEWSGCNTGTVQIMVTYYLKSMNSKLKPKNRHILWYSCRDVFFGIIWHRFIFKRWWLHFLKDSVVMW